MLQHVFPKTNLPYILPILIIFCFLIGLQLTRQAQYFYVNRLWGILVFLFILLLGMQLVQWKQQAKPTFLGDKQLFIATIIEEPFEKQNSYQTTLDVNYVRDSCCWKKVSANVLAYFGKDTNMQKLAYGDRLVIEAYINPMVHSGNPHAFNYKKYLAFHEIYHQTFIQPHQFRVLEHEAGPLIFQFSNQARNNLLTIYKKNHISGNEFAVLSALTLGYKEELSADIRESFSASGAMHILAVSGLHVGIIYIILVRMLFFLQRNRYGRVLQSLIIIFSLFFYAFITGLSSSVLRATIMFSIMALGKIFIRQSNIYNTIFFSAFVMLMANPYALTGVGFQLSYLAVLSIVFFYPRIYSLLEIKHSLPDKIWQLVAVALAAQIGTFPLTIYYFHQFPVYFILSNIFIIPLAMVLIYAAVLLLLLSPVNILVKPLALLVKYITYGLNFSVKTISDLPFSKIQNIQVALPEVILLYVVLLFLMFFILSKRITYLRLSILLFLAIPIYSLAISYIKSYESYLIVYNIPKVSALEFVQYSKNQLYINAEATQDSSFIKYNILPFWQHQQIKQPGIRQFNENPYQCFTFNGYNIIRVNSNWLTRYNTVSKLAVDYLILSESPFIEIEQLTERIDCKMIIFDSSNNYYSIARWKDQCITLGIPYHNLAEQGAFIKKESLLFRKVL
ncbi:MAG: ComEC/Rec2 family competence protein [Bacteroidales bacterium]|nr:ComEC/Rec2 family competence protein [Bacteroidales bacterium]